MRTTFLLTFFLIAWSVEAKGPTLRSLIAQMSCTDTVCMNDCARRYDLCPAGEDRGNPFSASCDALARGDTMGIVMDGGLMVMKKGRNDGSTSYVYVYTTSDRKHAAKLTKELNGLGPVESKQLPSGSAIYTTTGETPVYKVALQEKTMQVNERTVPVWIFAVTEQVD